jgi:hypothetical protein
MSLKYAEDKPASWIEGVMPADAGQFAHCGTITPDKLGVGGLDPSRSALDRLRTSDPNVMRYNCFLYAFAFRNGALSKAHKMSQWAVPGNYCYVFDGAGRRYMSDKKAYAACEVGFLDDVLRADILVYKIGAGKVLEPLDIANFRQHA